MSGEKKIWAAGLSILAVVGGIGGVEQAQAQAAEPIPSCSFTAPYILPNTVLSLAAAVDMALCHHPQLRSAGAAVRLQASMVGEAEAALWPSVTLSAGELRDRMGYPGTALPGTLQRAHTLYGSVTWRLLDFGGRSANQRYASALLISAMASEDAVLQKTMASVIAAYFDAQTASGNWKARQHLESLARQTLRTLQRREALGAASQTDTLQATVAVAKAALESSRARGAARRAMAILGYSMGWSIGSADFALAPLDSEGDSARDAPSIQDLRQTLDEWLTQALAGHPTLRAAQAQVQAAQERSNVVRSDGWPTLDATANLYQNGRPNQGAMPKTRETTLGLSLSIPVFEGFAREYKVAGAQAQLAQKEAALKEVEQQVTMDLLKAHADAASALSNLGASLDLLKAATQALASVQRKFDNGAADAVEVLTSQTVLTDATLERLRAQAEWQEARLRLFASAGQITRADLVR